MGTHLPHVSEHSSLSLSRFTNAGLPASVILRSIYIVAKRLDGWKPLCIYISLWDGSGNLVRLGQTAWWITMPLGKAESHGPGHILSDGIPVTPWKGLKVRLHQPSTFSVYVNRGPCLWWRNGWMNQDTWYCGIPRPGRHCVIWDPPTERGTAAPSFWSMSIVAKRSPISAI